MSVNEKELEQNQVANRNKIESIILHPKTGIKINIASYTILLITTVFVGGFNFASGYIKPETIKNINLIATMGLVCIWSLLLYVQAIKLNEEII